MSKNILITGGTGFIGSHVLLNLISNKNVANVYVISRHKVTNPAEGFQLISSIFDKYELQTNNKNIVKIKIIYGSISEFKIGINDDALYDYLAQTVDVIYHIAAQVHHSKSYDELKKVNVDGVKHIIEFSNQKNKKIINFISTLRAAVEKNSDGQYVEDFPNRSCFDISMGYLKSKHEAEKLLADISCRERVNIFRLGYISGSTKTGLGLYEKNTLMLFIKICVEIGYAPAINKLINFTPVDFASEIMGSEYFLSNSGNIMHLVNCKEYLTWLEIVDFLNREGFFIRKINLESWRDMLLREKGKDHPLYKIILYGCKNADKLFGDDVTAYKLENINEFCKIHRIRLPKIKFHYLRLLFKNLTKLGFISKR